MINFIQLAEAKGNQQFFQLPIALMQDDKYKDLSMGAKIAYTLFLNRHSCSATNGFKDKEGNVYFYYTNEELMGDLNRGVKAVTRVKKELVKHGLLRIVKRSPRRAADGTVTFQAPLLYLGEIQSSDEGGYKRRVTKDGQVKEKSSTAEDKKNSTEESGTPEGKKNSTKEPKITEKSEQKVIDEEREKLLLEKFPETIKSYNRTFLPDTALHLIQKFSNSVKEAKETVKAIHNAKTRAQQQTGEYIVYEEIEELGINPDAELYSTLHRAYMLQKTEKVKDIKNVIHIYVKNWFLNVVMPIKQLRDDVTLPKVSLENWLEEWI